MIHIPISTEEDGIAKSCRNSDENPDAANTTSIPITIGHAKLSIK